MTAAETSVLSQQKKAQVQSWLTKVRVQSKIIKSGPKCVENRWFGLKLGPEACQDRPGAFGMGLTHSKGRPRPGPGGPSRVHNVGSGPNHRKLPEMD